MLSVLSVSTFVGLDVVVGVGVGCVGGVGGVGDFDVVGVAVLVL